MHSKKKKKNKSFYSHKRIVKKILKMSYCTNITAVNIPLTKNEYLTKIEVERSSFICKWLPIIKADIVFS